MKRARRQYSADWKAKIALEAIKGQRTIQQIANVRANFDSSARFQSPLHRGNHFNIDTKTERTWATRISVPSSSGKSLQPTALQPASLSTNISVPSSSGKSLQHAL